LKISGEKIEDFPWNTVRNEKVIEKWPKNLNLESHKDGRESIGSLQLSQQVPDVMWHCVVFGQKKDASRQVK